MPQASGKYVFLMILFCKLTSIPDDKNINNDVKMFFLIFQKWFQPNWMHKRMEILGDQRYNDLFLAFTHDSGAYK